jgi:hypothetical protein
MTRSDKRFSKFLQRKLWTERQINITTETFEHE